MRIVRFLKSLWNYLLYGKRVSFDDYVERLNTCNMCKHLKEKNWICSKCGCYVTQKCKMSCETCPEGYWERVEE